MFSQLTLRVLTRRFPAWFLSGCTSRYIDQEEPMMNSYVEIQVQSPADRAGFVAQWYTGGECSGQAFPLCNIGELLFFAYFTEAPLIVPDDATRALLCERGYNPLNAAR
jgi:hypothetical protein